MECHLDANREQCTCHNTSCQRWGLCCECVANHRAKGQLPGCYFPPELEPHTRSIQDLAEYLQKKA